MKNKKTILIFGAALAALLLLSFLALPESDIPAEAPSVPTLSDTDINREEKDPGEPKPPEEPDNTDLPDLPANPPDTDGQPVDAPPSKVVPDDNGMMEIEGIYIEAPSPLDEASLTRLAEKLTSLKSAYLSDAAQIKIAVIPDKSWYAREMTDSCLDHRAMTDKLSASLPDWDFIELADLLTLTDYYATDRHWRQESLLPVARRIASSFGHDITDNFTVQSRDGFVGDYKRAIGSDQTETIRWLESPLTAAASCVNFQRPDITALYNPSLLSSNSPYDLFLGGPSPLVTLTNSQDNSQSRLIIFCDSFSGSLAPLLLEPYGEIILVDLRYMVNSLLPDYVDFTSSDILFLYSAELCNHSTLLR